VFASWSRQNLSCFTLKFSNYICHWCKWQSDRCPPGERSTRFASFGSAAPGGYSRTSSVDDGTSDLLLTYLAQVILEGVVLNRFSERKIILVNIKRGMSTRNARTGILRWPQPELRCWVITPSETTAWSTVSAVQQRFVIHGMLLLTTVINWLCKALSHWCRWMFSTQLTSPTYQVKTTWWSFFQRAPAVAASRALLKARHPEDLAVTDNEAIEKCDQRPISAIQEVTDASVLKHRPLGDLQTPLPLSIQDEKCLNCWLILQ
jgi:hypothetical protein